MGLFSHDDELKYQYKNVVSVTLKDLNEEFLAGFQYGIQEYSGAWEEKNWKDHLEKFAKALGKYDRISFIADSKNLGVSVGSLYGMLSSNLSYVLFNDDKASGLLMEILTSLKHLKAFNTKDLKKKIQKLSMGKLTEAGKTNHDKVMKIFLIKD
jgi:hypothetical protein